MTLPGVAEDLSLVVPSVSAELLEELGREFVEQHGRPQRHYHTLAHAQAVRDDVDRWSSAAGLDDGTAALVRLAAWYHDVIYEGRPGDDETASADFLADHLARLGRADLVESARTLVVVTISHEPTTAAEAVLVDADLGILAGTPEQYERYRSGVRAEYAHVDDESWRVGRAAVLTALLERPALFHGPAAPEREPRARTNLAAELASLNR